MNSDLPSTGGPSSVAPPSSRLSGPPSSRRNRKLRICVIASAYSRSEDDPGVPWLREAVGRLARREHDVTVVVPSLETLPDHTIDGVPVHRFRYAPRAGYIASGAAHLSLWIARRRFDVLHMHWPFPHAVLTSLAWTSGVPTAATCHWPELSVARRDTAVAERLRRSLLKASALSCGSSHAQLEIQRLCGRTANVIPRGAQIIEAPAPPSLREATGGPPVLLAGGRLGANDGVDVAIRALAWILRERAVRLVVAGEGPRTAELQALASELGVGDHVEMAGAADRSRLEALQRACHVYVHPVVFDEADGTEGLDDALIGACLQGCPVIASRVGAVGDALRHEETGLLFAERSERALAAGVLRLLEDRALARRLGDAARELARGYFDWERITDETETLYYRAMAVARARPGLEQRLRA